MGFNSAFKGLNVYYSRSVFYIEFNIYV